MTRTAAATAMIRFPRRSRAAMRSCEEGASETRPLSRSDIAAPSLQSEIILPDWNYTQMRIIEKRSPADRDKLVSYGKARSISLRVSLFRIPTLDQANGPSQMDRQIVPICMPRDARRCPSYQKIEFCMALRGDVAKNGGEKHRFSMKMSVSPSFRHPDRPDSTDFSAPGYTKLDFLVRASRAQPSSRAPEHPLERALKTPHANLRPDATWQPFSPRPPPSGRS